MRMLLPGYIKGWNTGTELDRDGFKHLMHIELRRKRDWVVVHEKETRRTNRDAVACVLHASGCFICLKTGVCNGSEGLTHAGAVKLNRTCVRAILVCLETRRPLGVRRPT